MRSTELHVHERETTELHVHERETMSNSLNRLHDVHVVEEMSESTVGGNSRNV
jgi:hypothetical protein